MYEEYGLLYDEKEHSRLIKKVECLTDRFMPNDCVYGLTTEYIKKAFLRPFKSWIDLPKISDMLRKIVVGEWTIEMRAEKAHFKIEDLDGILAA